MWKNLGDIDEQEGEQDDFEISSQLTNDKSDVLAQLCISLDLKAI